MGAVAEPGIWKKLKSDLGTRLIFLGIAVGICSGLAAVFFRWSIDGVRSLAFGVGPNIFEIVSQSGWRRIVMPALGGLLVGLIGKFFMGGQRGHGVPEVMEAVQKLGSRLPKRVILFKTLTSALTIGTGGSSGREGPIAHIGSAIGSAIGQLFKMKGELAKTMIGCGAAGGIAATFNAPIAGALFALEVIHGDVAIRHFTPIVISSVIATVISNALLKEVASFPALTSGQIIFQLKSAYEIPLYMILAVAAGGISMLFIRSMEMTEHGFEYLKVPNYTKPMIGGLLMAIVAFFVPQLYGMTNYASINASLEMQYIWYFVVLLVFLKIGATCLTLGSGGSGGIFAPSLFVGAMTGNSFGFLFNRIFPNHTAGPGSYALVGMGAVMAGVTQAPLTSVVLIFELTGKYTIILPLMITCAISTILVQITLKGSIFTRVLHKKGIYYGERRNILRRTSVKEMIRPEFRAVTPQTHFKDLLETLTHSKQYAFPVVDADRKLLGIISLQDFQEVVLEQALADVLVVGELMTADVVWVTPEENLENALLKIGDRNIEYLPVVESGENRRLLGLISRREILTKYNSEVLELKAQGDGA